MVGCIENVLSFSFFMVVLMKGCAELVGLDLISYWGNGLRAVMLDGLLFPFRVLYYGIFLLDVRLLWSVS